MQGRPYKGKRKIARPEETMQGKERKKKNLERTRMETFGPLLSGAVIHGLGEFAGCLKSS